MIDWTYVLTTSLWVTGLALVLAVGGYSYCRRRLGRASLARMWSDIESNPWTLLGAILFCAGLVSAATSDLARAVWALLVPVVTWLWWGSRRLRLSPRTPQAPEPYPPDRPRRNPVSRAAEWLVKPELLWLILLAPFFLLPSASPERLYPLFLLPAIWLLRFIALGRFVPSTPLDWPIALLLVMVLVSTYTSFNLTYSLPRITALLYAVGLYYAIVDWSVGGGRLGWTVALLAVAGTGFALLGLLGINWVSLLGQNWATKLFPVLGQLRGEIPPLLRGFLPDTSRWLHPSEVAGTLLWIAPLLLAVLGWAWACRFSRFLPRWAVRLGVLPLAAITVATIVASQTRGALAGLGVGLVLLALLAFARSSWPLRVTMAFAAVVLAGVIAYAGPGRLVDSLQISPSSLDADILSQSLETRTVIWSQALYVIRDFSYTGIGMDTFRWVIPNLYPVFPPDSRLNVTTSHPHNQFLQPALELGLPGLVAYLAIWMGSVAMVLQGWRLAPNSWYRAVAAGTGASLLSYFVYGLADVVSLGDRPGIFFWMLLGVVAALWRYATACRPKPPPKEVETVPLELPDTGVSSAAEDRLPVGVT